MRTLKVKALTRNGLIFLFLVSFLALEFLKISFPPVIGQYIGWVHPSKAWLLSDLDLFIDLFTYSYIALFFVVMGSAFLTKIVVEKVGIWPKAVLKIKSAVDCDEKTFLFASLFLGFVSFLYLESSISKFSQLFKGLFFIALLFPISGIKKPRFLWSYVFLISLVFGFYLGSRFWFYVPSLVVFYRYLCGCRAISHQAILALVFGFWIVLSGPFIRAVVADWRNGSSIELFMIHNENGGTAVSDNADYQRSLNDWAEGAQLVLWTDLLLTRLNGFVPLRASVDSGNQEVAAESIERAVLMNLCVWPRWMLDCYFEDSSLGLEEASKQLLESLVRSEADETSTVGFGIVSSLHIVEDLLIKAFGLACIGALVSLIVAVNSLLPDKATVILLFSFLVQREGLGGILPFLIHFTLSILVFYAFLYIICRVAQGSKRNPPIFNRDFS